MASPADELPVALRGLIPTPSGVGVFLGHAEKVIAIFVDHSVAAAITMTLQKVEKPRPLTHDLIGNILAGLGAKVRKVVINDLKDDTFYARIHLLQENELGKNFIEIDARPSDSIAIALQLQAPVYVVRKVWDAATDMSEVFDQAQAPDDDTEGEGEGEGPEAGA